MTAYADPLAAVVMERISELIRWRTWYRRQPNWSNWMDLARDNDVRLRELVKLARQARRAEAAKPDPITFAKGYIDWVEAGKREAWGR